MKNIVLGLVTLFISCSSLTPKSQEKVLKLTILHTNDHHGRFWSNRDGEYGLAARASLIKKIRKEVKEMGGEVLLLDAGDVNTGVPQSDLLHAEPDFRGMAALGYDVMAVGNHEFDQPVKMIFKQQSDWAKFPFISANIYHKKNKRLFPSHITKEIQGRKITIFGLTTEDTPKKSNPKNSQGLYFRPAVEEAMELVPILRPDTDLLVALTHTGHYPDEKHGADAPGDVTIARSVKGIDLIVGGHTQKPLFKPDIQNGTIIVQAFEWGKYLGRIDLEVGSKKMKLVNYQLIPVNLKDSKERIESDPQIEKLLKPFKDKGDKSLLLQLGSADHEFIGKRDVIRSQETNLGNLITNAYKEKFKADLAICNSGGIRDSIYPGKVTLETVLMVLPFGGEIVTAEISGEELRHYLETIIVTNTPGSGSFPQMSGVEVILDRTKGKAKLIKIGGKELDLNKKYLIALPEFIAAGGDKYPALNLRKYGYVDADILKDYIQRIKNLRSKDYAPKGYIKIED
jgi:5'-nucleotidase/UDP-sugar diphosphatase